MRNVVIVKAAQQVYDRIGLADIREELIAQSLALTGTLDQPRYVDNLYRGRHRPLRMLHLDQLIETLIRHGDDPNVGFDRAEGEVGRLRLSIRQAVKQSGLTDVG